MECNKEAAERAMNIAEKKLSKNDYVGAKKYSEKAHNLYPQLDGLKQVLMMINVYVIASNMINGTRESDWYRILGVEPLADDEAVKKQYKKLALLLHPDKNKRKGAEGAFKLVSEAWCVLSDKVKRVAYDQKRKSGMQNQQNPASDSPPASGMQRPPDQQKRASYFGNQNARPGVDPKVNVTSCKPAPGKNGVPFWTMCTKCNTQCTYLREHHLNRTVHCPNCGQAFIATERSLFTRASPPQRQQQRQQSVDNKATNKNTNGSLFCWTVCKKCNQQVTFTRSSRLTTAILCPGCGQTFIACEETPPVQTQATSQAQERLKRAFRESQEKTTFKRPRTAV